MKDDALILVIEDEPNTRRLILVTLAQSGYSCLHAMTGIAGIAATFDDEPSAVLLDLGLPDLDGLEVIQRIRDRSQVPIIVVSARGKETEKVAALDSGANDYLTKPFGPAELLARIRVALRTTTSPTGRLPETGKLTTGDLSIDLDNRFVTIAGNDVHLTPIEYRLLVVMMASAGRVVTHRQILRQVWGPRYGSEVNYLRVYMTKLRHKIEREPARPRYLVKEAGIGYRLRLPTQPR